VTHSEIRAQLSEYLERDLDPDQRSLIAAHLESCASCGSELHELRSTVSLLRRLPEPGHPDGLADAVLARVAQDARGPARVRWLRRVSEPRFAAPLAAGIAGFFLLLQPDDRNRPAQPTAADRLGTAVASTRPSDVRAGVVSGATPPAAHAAMNPPSTYLAYERRAKLEEMARQLRGAGHPFSESLAAHFESQPTVSLASWSPR
jgi:anti-sigma factor RsiW